MNTSVSESMETEPVESIHPARTSLEDLSASRIIAVLLGSILAIFGFFSSLIWISRIIWHSESGFHELPQLAIYGLVPLISGIVLCWAGFRRGYESIGESRIARLADTGLSIVFGVILAGGGLFLCGLYLVASIAKLTRGESVALIGLAFRGAFAAGILMLGVTILRKAFANRS